MVCVTVDCPDGKFCAVRGERCKSLIQTKRNDGFTTVPHVWRTGEFQRWKKWNKDKYRKLLDQIIAERTSEEEHYETCPA